MSKDGVRVFERGTTPQNEKSMKTIFVVEDDHLLNKTLVYNLSEEGYEVTSVFNARAAADMLRRSAYDLVLLDINLPDGDGYDLCRLVRLQNPDTIVIF